MKRVIAVVSVLLAGTVQSAGADEVRFTKAPTVSKVAEGVKIEFAVNRMTDVAVAVLDAKGRVVRHLAAGVLGPNAPAPFKKDSLAQEILWDGKDDLGKAVAGPCRVRVGLGLKGAFDRFLGRDGPPNLRWWFPRGIAVDRDGSVFVMITNGFWDQQYGWVCKFSREGEYLRTIVPPPATTPPERLPGVHFLSREPGQTRPRIYCHLSGHVLPYFRGLKRQTPVMTRDGRLVMVAGYAGELFGWKPRFLLVVNRDGTIPRERVHGPAIARGVVGGYVHLALTPDERSVYVSGLGGGRHGSTPKSAHHVVYKVGLGLEDEPVIFAGELRKPGNDERHLNFPQGVATDPDGNVYVADCLNHRVVVYDAAGKVLAQVPVPGPDCVRVHPKTRAMYVTSLTEKGFALLKIAGFREPAVVWKWDRYPRKGPLPGRYIPVLGLDRYAEKPILYLAGECRTFCVLRLVDEGETWSPGEELPGTRDRPEGLSWASLAGVHGQTVYVKDRRTSWVYDGTTGRRSRFWAGYYDAFVVGRDRYFYMPRGGKGWLKPGGIHRVDAQKKPVPFSATGARCEPYWHFWLGRRGDVWVTPRSEMYVLEFGREPQGKDFGGAGEAVVSCFNLDGTFRKRGLVTGLQAPVGIRVDSRGNVYLADNLKPAGRYYPDDVAALVRRCKDDEALGAHVEYGAMYGSLLKFPPSGGTIRRLGKDEPVPDPERHVLLETCTGQRRFAVEGCSALYLGVSLIPPHRGVISNCFCARSFFDIDRFDRLFVPDSARFCVHVLDSNFNSILGFGGYDNIDSKGGEANAPGPSIPLSGRPITVMASDSACYIYDRAHQRITRVRLTYAAEASCRIE